MNVKFRKTKTFALLALITLAMFVFVIIGWAEAAIDDIPADFSFQKNLQLGNINNDVKYLQILLKAEGVCPNCLATSYFGAITKQGVMAFQTKYAAEILTPYGLTTPTGFVGSSTRAKLNNLLASGHFEVTPTTAGAPRGISGDLWADIEIGRRNFTEMVPNKVVPYKVYNPGGVAVDRSVSPGRLYVWDSGNSRIVGVDLGKCYSQNPPCSADIIIGQPSGYDYGACNQDDSFQTYPNRPASSASTICGISEQTHTVLEDKNFVSMIVDNQGNLFVPDANNNRVLKFNNPFTTDTIADEVWGQSNFTGNLCNLTGKLQGGASPTASSLCFCSVESCGMGVAFDGSGNLWVTDGGNNRVLRFPKNQTTGQIAKTADLVLGQPNFTTGVDWSFGSAMNQMRQPVALTFDKNGRLYVADSNNLRVLVFYPPFTSGMNAIRQFASNFNDGLQDIRIEKDPENPANEVVWTYEHNGGVVKLWNINGTLKTSFRTYLNGGGSIGFDNNGNVLTSVYEGASLSDVYVFTKNQDGTYTRAKNLFTPPTTYNGETADRFATPAWVGVTTAANQLIVGEGRLLFWNDLNSLTNGKAADGYIGASSVTERPFREFTQVKSDNANRVWVSKYSEIRVYQAPLTIGAQPIKVITSPLPVLGGGEIKPIEMLGLAPTTDGNFLWVSEPGNHRVYRIRNPLTNPVVDIVLGQTTIANNTTPDNGFDPAHPGDPDHPNMCNRGEIPPPNSGTTQVASLNMLCFPGAISLDKKGNLFVSDHMIESAGNWRLLMFSASLFPTNNSQVLFAPTATKSFPLFPLDNHRTFEPAFDSHNRMVVGLNPYSGKRFVDYYNDPTRVNPANPSDPAYAAPDGQLKDYYGWAVAATFDANDNLYVYDANRGRVMIYKQPFGPPVSPSPTPLPPTPLPPTPLPPTAPSSLTVTAVSSSQINLNWTDNSTNETSFEIERSLSASSGFSQMAATAANVTTYQNTGLASATTYYYRVRAVNSAGHSDYSNVTSGKTFVSPTPDNKPDLVVLDIKLYNAAGQVITDLIPGQPVTCKAVIKNQGGSSAEGYFHDRWSIDSEGYGLCMNNSLPSGETIENCALLWTPAIGTHTLRFETDYYNSIAESSETNNSLSKTITVSQPAPAATLAVRLTANPSTGIAPLYNVSLTAVVSGTATGPINYKFDCSSDGIWEHAFSNIPDLSKTIDACNYLNARTQPYTATVYVERGGLTSQAMAAITVTPAQAPAITILSPNGGEILKRGENYTIKWTSQNLPAEAKILIGLSRADALNCDIVSGLPISSQSYVWPVGSEQQNCGYGYQHGRTYATGPGPGADLTKYKISIYALWETNRAFDMSDDYFTILEPGLLLLGSSPLNPYGQTVTKGTKQATLMMTNLMALREDIDILATTFKFCGTQYGGICDYLRSGHLINLKVYRTDTNTEIGRVVPSSNPGYLAFSTDGLRITANSSINLALKVDISTTIPASSIDLSLSADANSPITGKGVSTGVVIKPYGSVQGMMRLVSPLPDLEVSAIKFYKLYQSETLANEINPADLSKYLNQDVTIKAILINKGGADAGPFNVKWYFDGIEVGYGGHASLPANGIPSEGNVRGLWTVKSGNRSLLFKADVDNYINELNENNNSFELKVTIPSPTPPPPSPSPSPILPSSPSPPPIYLPSPSPTPISSPTPGVNHPPIASAGLDKTVYTGISNQQFILDGSGSYDPDPGDTIKSYYWYCDAGTLSNNRIAQPTYTAPTFNDSFADSSYSCALTVTDSQGLETMDGMNVWIKKETISPFLSALIAILSQLKELLK